ncbi:hypothetical protein STA3757_00120 [Stanieria sp. NIES-3757]|nr:hypothetical protein STA3757_00120 [Stanieria sp. NIES-3757]
MIHHNQNGKIIPTTVVGFILTGMTIVLAEPVATSPLLKQSNSNPNNCCVNPTQSYPNQGYPRHRGWGYRNEFNRMYNLNTVETISGEVISINAITSRQGMSQGVHLQLKTEQEVINVHLGPSWYLDNQNIQIQPKDKIEVTGSKVNFDGQPSLIAAQVKKGKDTLVLRDENGFPVWSRWRQSQF